MKKEERMCWWCRYFHCEQGQEDWSDITPGEEPAMECNKGHWRIDMVAPSHTLSTRLGFRPLSRLTLMDCLKKAKNCEDFELHEDLRPEKGEEG